MAVCTLQISLSVALGVLLVCIIIFSGLLLASKPAKTPHRLQSKYAPGVSLAVDGTDKLADSGMTDKKQPHVTLLPVIPLVWDSSTGTYNISIYVGTDFVHAAFDTGSAQFVVTTDECKTCSGSIYIPTRSPSAFAVLDGASSKDRHALCRASISYVSQSDTLQIYGDTVTIPRTLAPDCLGRPRYSSEDVAPITVTHFPVGGIIANTGHSSVNVFGMSGVMTEARDPRDSSLYILPSCQTSTEPIYESPILQAISMYNRGLDEPMVWSMRFAHDRADGASVMFRKSKNACDRPLFHTPAVRVIPDAPSKLVGTPYRYYVIEVESAATYHGSVPLPSFPRYLLVDTATTQFMVPAKTSVDTLRKKGLVLTLASSGGSKLEWPGSREDDHYGTSMYTEMPDGVASEFSHSHNVGILGNLAMRGRYIEFVFEHPRTIGFG